jgi:hypothetical protein
VKVPIIQAEAIASASEEESEEEEETVVNPPTKKRKLKAAGATPVGKIKPKNGESFFICSMIYGNGKRCCNLRVFRPESGWAITSARTRRRQRALVRKRPRVAIVEMGR